MGSLTIGFNGKNYIFPCRELKIHDSHLKPGKYVQWVQIVILSLRKHKVTMQNENENQKNLTNFVKKWKNHKFTHQILWPKTFSFLNPYHFTSYFQHCL